MLTVDEIRPGMVYVFSSTKLDDDRRIDIKPKSSPGDERYFVCLKVYPNDKSCWGEITKTRCYGEYQRERFEIKPEWRSGICDWNAKMDKDWGSRGQYLNQYDSVYMGENAAFMDASGADTTPQERRRIVTDDGVNAIIQHIEGKGFSLSFDDFGRAKT